MRIKKSALILIMIISLGCGDEKVKNSSLKKNLPKIKDNSKNLNYIFTNGFNFTDATRIDRIGIFRISKNRYKIFYFLSNRTDLKKVQEFNIAFRVYPVNPNEFKSVANQESKARTIASKCNLKLMGENFVIVSEEFFIAPKMFKESKIFFYEPKAGIVGKTMTILNLNFDF